MEEIDLIGTYSDADDIGKHSFPLLMKMIASANKKYKVKRILLNYCSSDSFEKTQDIIKNNFKDYCNSIFKNPELYKIILDITAQGEKTFDWKTFLVDENYYFIKQEASKLDLKRDEKIMKDINEKNPIFIILYHPNEQGISVVSHFSALYSLLEMSSSNTICLNMKSGNVESREALTSAASQYVSLNKPKKFLMYEEEGYPNVPRNKLSSDYIDEDDDKAGFPGKNYIGRLQVKNVDQSESLIQAKVTEAQFKASIQNNHYQEAHRMIENKKSMIRDNKGLLKLFFHAMDEKYQFPSIVHNNRFTLEDLSTFIGEKLLYLTFLKKEGGGKFTSYAVFHQIERLLYVIHQFENFRGKYISDNGNGFFMIKDDDDYDYVKRFNNYYESYNNVNNGRIEYFKIPGGNSFDRIYKTLRHPTSKTSPNEMETCLCNMIGYLSDKYSGNKGPYKYCSYDRNNPTGANIPDLFEQYKKQLSECKFQFKHNLTQSWKKQIEYIKNEFCYVAFLGSRDPYGYLKKEDTGLKQDIRTFGSTVLFAKALKEMSRNQIHAPFYLLVSKEEGTRLINNKEDQELKCLIGQNKVFFLPYTEDFNVLRNCINNKKSLEDVVALAKDGSGHDKYDYNSCFKVTENLIILLKQKHKHILAMESSGIPYVKMDLTYFSSLIPDYLHILMVKDPLQFYSDKFIPKNAEEITKTKTMTAPTNIMDLKDLSLVTDEFYRKERVLSLSNELVLQEILPLELEQSLENEGYDIDPEMKDKLDQLQNYNSKIKDDDVPNNLCLVKNMLKKEKYVNLVNQASFLFQLVFCCSYIDKIFLESGNPELKEFVDVKKKHKVNSTNVFLKKMKNKDSGLDLKQKYWNTCRFGYAISYVYLTDYLKKDPTDAKNLLTPIKKCWEKCSNLKHKTEEISFDFNTAIENVISFLDTNTRNEYDKLNKLYFDIEEIISAKIGLLKIRKSS